MCVLVLRKSEFTSSATKHAIACCVCLVPSLALMYTVLATIFSSSIAVGEK